MPVLIEETFKQAAAYLVLGIESCAALIIAFAVLQALTRILSTIARRQVEAPEQIRLGLGRWLALALEFELAADILGTAVAPSWDDLGKVAAIIALRTALNYFLQREIRELAHQAEGR